MWTNLYVVTRSDYKKVELDEGFYYDWSSYPVRIFDNEEDAIKYKKELEGYIEEFKSVSTVRIDLWKRLADGFGWTTDSVCG